MKKPTSLFVLAAVGAILFASSVRAQTEGFDSTAVAAAYHKLSGDSLDLEAAAQQSASVQRATNFDRPDAINAEIARLRTQLASANPAREFVISVNDNITQYDHDHGEFSIGLFQPGYFVPLEAFGQRYQLVFANAERARAIPMEKAAAREFDTKLNAIGRGVLNEIHFKVTGQGDPAGAVTGPRVIRAEITSARLLDRQGRLVFTPAVTASPTLKNVAATNFDPARVDIAGFHVGVSAADFAATLERLFGPVTTGKPDRNAFPGIAGTVSMNGDGCFSYPGRRNNPHPGAVCVTGYVDNGGTVRSIRVERLFAPFNSEVFRKALTQKYGPVAAARNGSTFTLGWGPTIDSALVYDRSGPRTALTAHYTVDSDFLGDALGGADDVRLILTLVDAAWASKSKE
jgi:uncharacterized protein DUF4852